MIKDLYWMDVENERDMKNQEPWDFWFEQLTAQSWY